MFTHRATALTLGLFLVLKNTELCLDRATLNVTQHGLHFVLQ